MRRRPRSTRPATPRLAGALASLVVAGGTILTACGSSSPAATVTVMTRNLDEGTDFGPLLHAATLADFLSAATSTWMEVQASNIAERAAGVAKEIAATRPDLVSIEEASVWRTGPLLKGPAPNVVYDALGSLASALAADGAAYRVAVSETESDLEGPTSLGYDVRVTDVDAILARSDVRIANPRSGHFRAVLTLTPVGVKQAITRGWTSVDVTADGKTVRYVETHLETFSNSVQAAQASELVAGPVRTDLPVVLACDCNTGPGVTPTYRQLLSSGGFTDAWTAAHPSAPGLTWALHKEDPYVATATPTERIDLVLVKGAVTAEKVELVGDTTADLTPSGLWPSDHAAVLATLGIG